MIQYFTKRSYYKGERWYTQCKTSPFTPVGRRPLAMAAANAMGWGSTNSLLQVWNNDDMVLYRADAAGHGGYLLIARNPLEEVRNARYELVGTANSDDSYPGGYVYVFEEDCAWALLREVLPADGWRRACTHDGNGFVEMDALATKMINHYYKPTPA